MINFKYKLNPNWPLIISSSCGGSEPCKAGCNVHPKPKKIGDEIDLTDLQNELMDYWDDLGVHYCDRVNVGFLPPDPDFYQTNILPKYQEMLDDPMTCIAILGFDSIASYLLSKEL